MILGTSGGDLGTFCSGLGMQNHSVVDPSIQNYIRLILSLFVSTRMLLGWSLNRFAFFTTLFIIHVGEVHQPQVQVEKEWKAHWSRRLTMIQRKHRGRPSTWQPTFRQAQPATTSQVRVLCARLRE